MKYRAVVEARFVSRPNRFVAVVELDGRRETVHVKNTGRCSELLVPGARVWLEDSGNPNRKTRYDLVVVHKEGLGLVNMDSQAPNKVAHEWLETQGFSLIKAEHSYGSSRIDFYMERRPPDSWGGFAQSAQPVERYLMEVKGCTLEVGGAGYFPDAPTERGVRHLQELAAAARLGYHCIAAFVIQMEGVAEVRPNVATHPAFGEALAEAEAAGVRVLFLCCAVESDQLWVREARWGGTA